MRFRDPVHPISLLAIPFLIAAVRGGRSGAGAGWVLVLMAVGLGVLQLAGAMGAAKRARPGTPVALLPHSGVPASADGTLQSQVAQDTSQSQGAHERSAVRAEAHASLGPPSATEPTSHGGWALDELMRREG